MNDSTAMIPFYLDSLLVILCRFLFDIVVGSDWFTKLSAHHHTRANCCWTTTKHHDTSTGIGECGLCKIYVSKQASTTKKETLILSRTSSNPTATLIATPVQRSARLSFATGQGSRCKFSKMEVNTNSQSLTGSKNLNAFIA